MESELFRQYAIMNTESRRLNDSLYLEAKALTENLTKSVKELTAQISSISARLAALEGRVGAAEQAASSAAEQAASNATAVTANAADIANNTSLLGRVETTLRQVAARVEEVAQASTGVPARLAALEGRVGQVVNQTTRSLDGVRNDVTALVTAKDQQNTRINSNLQTITKVSNVVSYLKDLYYVKRTVLSQTTDSNGFTRIDMASFPTDIIAYSNDYVMAINVYDYRVSNYDTLVVSMCDYSNDSYLNVRVAYYSGKTFTGNCRLQAWYLALNPAKDLPL